MQSYFVMQLTDHDLIERGRTISEQRFEIQLLDTEGRAAACGYVSSKDTTLEIQGRQIPKAVIEAAKRQSLGQGDYVNCDGQSVSLF